MGLFIKPRRVARETHWKAVWPVEAIPAAGVSDDGCAGEQAHQVWFALSPKPGGPMIAIAFYASYGPPADGTHLLGYRYTYFSHHPNSHVSEPWTYTGWGNTGEEYAHLARADGGARNMAHGYREDWGAPAADELGGVFTWDGVPW